MRTIQLLVLSLWIAAAQGAVQKAEELLHKGFLLEEVKGELEKAIEVYKEIVQNHSDNKAAAARAQLHIGICYEKLGQEAARAAYRKVIEDYRDEADVVAIARQKLSALEKPDAKMTVKLVWSGREVVDPTGVLSPDSTRIAYTDWGTGNLAIKDLANGKITQVTDVGWFRPPGFVFVTGQVWSPDGKRIAYGLYNDKLHYELRVISPEGGASKVLYSNPEFHIYPTDWSGDGKQILCTAQRKDNSYLLALISAETGAFKQLVSLEWQPPTTAVFSPDNRYIAFDLTKEKNRDIYVLSVQKSEMSRITDSPAEDENPLWSPDGKLLVFRSNRSGNWDLWGVPIQDGHAGGPAALVKSGLNGRLTSWSSSGKLLYGTYDRMNDVYTVPVDPSAGQATGPPSQVTKRFAGKNEKPTWSPDGKRIAYISFREGNAREEDVLCVLSLESGEEQEFELGLQRSDTSSPRWSPDGKRIAITGKDEKGARCTYAVDVGSGEKTLLVRDPSLRDWSPLQDWSPDGKSILFTRRLPDDATPEKAHRGYQNVLYAMDVATREVKEIILEAPPALVDGLGLGYQRYSPDGQQIAFIRSFMKEGRRHRALFVVSSAGGKAREVFTMAEKDGRLECAFHQPCWSPRGDKLAMICYGSFSTNPGGAAAERISPRSSFGSRILVVSLSDQAAIALNTSGIVPRHTPSWSRDGTQIAFTGGQGSGGFWVMENFLPKGEKTSLARVRN